MKVLHSFLHCGGLDKLTWVNPAYNEYQEKVWEVKAADVILNTSLINWSIENIMLAPYTPNKNA